MVGLWAKGGQKNKKPSVLWDAGFGVVPPKLTDRSQSSLRAGNGAEPEEDTGGLFPSSLTGGFGSCCTVKARSQGPSLSDARATVTRPDQRIAVSIV